MLGIQFQTVYIKDRWMCEIKYEPSSLLGLYKLKVLKILLH